MNDSSLSNQQKYSAEQLLITCKLTVISVRVKIWDLAIFCEHAVLLPCFDVDTSDGKKDKSCANTKCIRDRTIWSKLVVKILLFEYECKGIGQYFLNTMYEYFHWKMSNYRSNYKRNIFGLRCMHNYVCELTDEKKLQGMRQYFVNTLNNYFCLKVDENNRWQYKNIGIFRWTR